MEQKLLQNKIATQKDKSFQSPNSPIQNNLAAREAQHIVKQKEAVKFQELLQNHLKPLQTNSQFCDQLSKRSDESQFVNWEITTVKSGKFIFNQKQQSEPKRQSLYQHSAKKQSSQAEGEMPKKSIKVNKTAGSHTKEVHKYFVQTLKEVLVTNKAIRSVFNHFCKQNNLTSMKSTLFDEKIKAMEEMTLNKWMVFCKQFEIYSKLCKIKSQNRQNLQTQQKPLPQTPKVRDLHFVRQAKQVEKRLIDIFKISNNNASKMNFQGFVAAVCEIYFQFKPMYAEDDKGISQFLSEVMYCQQQKACFKKLSSLKFTFSTPKIQYNKVSFPKGEVVSRMKTIERHKQNIQTSIPKQNSFSTVNKISKHGGKLTLNPILCQAKRTVEEPSIYAKNTNSMQKNVSKIKLKDTINIKVKQKQKQLFEYFQSSKDPILQSYFSIQTGKKNLVQAKKI